MLAQLKRFPGRKLSDRGDGMKKIPWETLAEQMKPQIAPVDANPIAVGQYPTFDEIRSGVRGRYPNIPEKAFEAEDINRAFKSAIQAPGAVGEGKGAQLLDCMWAHLHRGSRSLWRWQSLPSSLPFRLRFLS